MLEIIAGIIVVFALLCVLYCIYEAHSQNNRFITAYENMVKTTELERRYLLDRIQSKDPIVAHGLNVVTPPQEPLETTMDFPGIDGVPVRKVK